MDGAAAASTLSVFVQILLLDLLLSGDNAVVIALACRRLPPEKARKAAWLGAAGAIFLRLALTLVTGALMKLPFLQLVSGCLLLIIALNLMAERHEEAHLAYDLEDGMLAAAGLIVISDAAMSLDNVVALAAVSGGSFWLLAFGLVLTIPLIVYGSFGFSRMMQLYPLLVDIGGALLGWVAGGMVAGDPLFASYVAVQAPALGIALPLACALFVLIQGRWARGERAARPARRALPAAAAPERREAALAPVFVENAAKVACVSLETKPTSTLQPPVEPRREPMATPPSQAKVLPPGLALAPAPKPPAPAIDEPAGEGDRWMLIGLLALFVLFGGFLAITLIITE